MFHQFSANTERLSRLYSDTKKSLERAKAAPAAANVADSPEFGDLRRDFQLQQDRLYAWGLHWAERDMGSPQSKHGDVKIDKMIDQAELGEVVDSVMSEIRGLYDELQLGRLERSDSYEKNISVKSLKDPGSSPVTQRSEWTSQEIKSRRAKLDRLTECIDLLYTLEGTRRGDEKDQAKRAKHAHESSDNLDYAHVYDHPLHIEFGDLQFSASSAQRADPPPYEPPGALASVKERSLAYYRPGAQHVLLDYLPADTPLYVVGSADDVFEVHELGGKLCEKRPLSWCGHLRLLGFTIDPTGARCAMVYALPQEHDTQSLQQLRTLGSLISASDRQGSPHPALEDRFRLAYNVALSMMGYFAHGETHQHINSSNILVLGSGDHIHSSNAPKEMRSPYLLQSCQDFLSQSQAEEPFASTIYRHPDHDVRASEVVPAYDIYSLGLLLLEIALWTPLSRLWKPRYTREVLMDRVQRVYVPKLASRCGTKYMRVVQRCLQAPTALQYQNNYEDAGSALLQILKDLQQCCALDEEGPPPPQDIEVFEILLIEQMYKAESAPDAGSKSAFRPTKAETKPELPKRANSKRKADAVQDAIPQVDEKMRKWSHLDIPQDDLDQWNTRVMPKLGRILQTALKDCTDSCSLSLMMFGTTPEKAKTTICVQCPQINKVRDVLRQSFKPKRGWGVVLLNGEVRRSGNRKSVKRSGYGSSKGTGRSRRKLREQKYQKCPSNGASIGAFKDSEHLPPVSFGGTILVDGEPFGMTVHHMLEAPSDEEDEDEAVQTEQPRRSGATRTLPGQFDSSADVQFMQSEEDLARLSDLEISDEDFEGSDGESDASTIRPDYSIMDADGNEFWYLDDSPPELDEDDGSIGDDASSSSSDDVDDAASIGDKIGIAPYSDDDFCVTQPAIDDVDEDFFPSEEDRDDDHLASHSFGYVFASSGIRRVVRGEMKHEVDWALIRIHDDRMKIENSVPEQTGSLVKRSSTNTQQQPQPPLTTVTPLAKLSGLQVQCRGRSSGLKKGRISQAMSLVKLHGRQSFSTSWCVEGGFGIPGDSGAWVYDPVSGGLCGHVLAWGDRSKTAYIAPMEVLFDDIRGRLGARCVELPASAGLQKDEVVGFGAAVESADIAARLRDLKINTKAASEQPVPGASSKKTERVGVRPLVMAGAVS
ncbi:hypothetical protein EDD37DRAFT_431247 [Exophiala viscosa]|uniref:uncharacterized protein n=1 Tax=Exophiala viscosa TaxID=2486360 RepID=UPI0021990998|nr:hypothetical protein EDD37DRAFT_431247 [Exophiala viscosa]